MKFEDNEDNADEPQRLHGMPKGVPISGDPCEMFLVHSIIYYKMDNNIVSDQVFDSHCRWMRQHAAEIHSPYEKFVDLGDLRCTGYHGSWDALPQELFDKADRMLAKEGW